MSHTRRQAACALVIILLPATLFATPSSGATGDGTVPGFAGDSIVGLDQRLIGVSLKAGTFSRAQNDLRATETQASEALEDVANIERKSARINDRLGALEEVKRRAVSDQQRWKAASDEAIVAAYHQQRTATPVVYDSHTDLKKVEAERAFGTAAQNAIDAYTGAVRQKQRAEAEGVKRRTELDELAAKKATIASDLDRIAQQHAAAEKRMRSSIASSVVMGLDIPLVTLDSYLRAERTAASTLAQCRLPWWALAGIGRVESNHARYGGAFPSATGRVNPPIIGAALDGTGVGGNTVPIASPDGGALTGDPVFDHAVGPMQFITSTWKALGSDGNGDRSKDPQNVYDATLAAAKLLCQRAPASGLTTDGALKSAFKRYNNSDDYASLVLDWGRKYERIGLPKPLEATAE